MGVDQSLRVKALIQSLRPMASKGQLAEFLDSQVSQIPDPAAVRPVTPPLLVPDSAATKCKAARHSVEAVVAATAGVGYRFNGSMLCDPASPDGIHGAAKAHGLDLSEAEGLVIESERTEALLRGMDFMDDPHIDFFQLSSPTQEGKDNFAASPERPIFPRSIRTSAGVDCMAKALLDKLSTPMLADDSDLPQSAGKAIAPLHIDHGVLETTATTLRLDIPRLPCSLQHPEMPLDLPLRSGDLICPTASESGFRPYRLRPLPGLTTLNIELANESHPTHFNCSSEGGQVVAEQGLDISDNAVQMTQPPASKYDDSWTKIDGQACLPQDHSIPLEGDALLSPRFELLCKSLPDTPDRSCEPVPTQSSMPHGSPDTVVHSKSGHCPPGATYTLDSAFAENSTVALNEAYDTPMTSMHSHETIATKTQYPSMPLPSPDFFFSRQVLDGIASDDDISSALENSSDYPDLSHMGGHSPAIHSMLTGSFTSQLDRSSGEGSPDDSKGVTDGLASLLSRLPTTAQTLWPLKGCSQSTTSPRKAVVGGVSDLDLFLLSRGLVQEDSKAGQSAAGDGAQSQLPCEPPASRAVTRADSRQPSPPMLHGDTLTSDAPRERHHYLAQLRIVQNRCVLRELKKSCNVSLVEVASVTTCAHDCDCDLILDPTSSVIFFKLSHLPAAMKDPSMDLKVPRELDIRRMLGSGRYDRTLVVLEAFMTATYEQVQETEPLRAAKEKLRYHAEHMKQTKGYTIHVSEATSPAAAARLCRDYADTVQAATAAQSLVHNSASIGEAAFREQGFVSPDQVWRLRDCWLRQVVDDERDRLQGETGLNPFAATLVLAARGSMATFIADEPQRRLRDFGAVIGKERIERINALWNPPLSTGKQALLTDRDRAD